MRSAPRRATVSWPPRAAVRAAACAGVMAAIALVVGCAGLGSSLHPRPAAAPPASAAAPAPAGAAAPGGTSASVDSAPSSEAQGVLGTIPEPLSPAERVPAPGRLSASDSAHASRDSAAATAAETTQAETTGAETPVPTLTTPLGERPGVSGQALPESALVPSAPPPPAAATSDTCWRLQVGAPPEKAKAEGLQSAASSQLLVPFVIEREKGRYKVRSRDCMDRAGVHALRLRAQRSGFEGAFSIKSVKKP